MAPNQAEREARPSTLRLVLLRHGEPEQRFHGRCYGSLDVGLSPAGRVQVQKALERMTETRIHALYVSPRQRSRESALPLAAKFGIKPVVVPELREIDFGAFEGLTYEEVEARYPVEYRQWMEHPTQARFPGGESFAEMKRRILEFAGTLPAIHSGQTVAIVSHGGVNRVFLATALGMRDEMIFRLQQSYAGLSVIDYHDDFPVVRQMNG